MYCKSHTSQYCLHGRLQSLCEDPSVGNNILALIGSSLLFGKLNMLLVMFQRELATLGNSLLWKVCRTTA